MSPSLKSTLYVCFARSTFVCLFCHVLIIFSLSSFVIGRFCEPGIGILGVRPRYLWLGDPSMGFELGVLFRKSIILCRDWPFSFGFFIMILNECTQDSANLFDSLFFGLEWFMVIPSLFAHSLKVFLNEPALSHLIMSGLPNVFIMFSRMCMTVFVHRLSVWLANMYQVALSAMIR